ncbi:antibiotic biosynthesis monooxygenase family protein [Risungbinella massiliensis]|uniref:antibiotic biosynthesis monooxygenase family protein n=1 Tax=Risungbinella massiliensis TaxID=1329796 RepID=UPI0005CC87EF|nr:antibiotic biosynthesis monooxygenase [Risungbinella massiliensis]
MSDFANTPNPPYFAVIFTSNRTEGDHGYGAMSDEIEALAKEQPGFLGVESVRDSSGYGITISYWESEKAIRDWKQHTQHKIAQDKGKAEWYRNYKVRICKVERDYERSF